MPKQAMKPRRAIEDVPALDIDAIHQERGERTLDPILEQKVGLSKEPRFESQEYLDFIRKQDCLVPACGVPSDPHHYIRRKANGTNATDLCTLPICRVHHTEIHHLGDLRFEEKHGVLLGKLVWNFLHRFLKEQGLATSYK